MAAEIADGDQLEILNCNLERLIRGDFDHLIEDFARTQKERGTVPDNRPQGAPAPVIPFPDRQHPKHHVAFGFVWAAAWMCLNGGRIWEIEVEGAKVFFHIGFDTNPDPLIVAFYQGAATVEPIALARKVNELMAMVYRELPTGLALPDQLAGVPAPGPSAS